MKDLKMFKNQISYIKVILIMNRLNLYNHQLVSVENMERFERERNVFINNDVKLETQIGINSDKTGYGKCLGRNTPIIMYNGDVKMVQDVEIGDELMGDDSKPRKVLSTTIGVDTMYKIIQSNADDYVVNSSHILSLTVKKRTMIFRYRKKFRALYFDTNKLKFVSKYFKYNRDTKNEIYEQTVLFLKSLSFPIVDIPLLDYLNLPRNIRRNLMGVKAKVRSDNWKNEWDGCKNFHSFLGLWLALSMKKENGVQCFKNFDAIYEHITNVFIPNNLSTPTFNLPDKEQVEKFCIEYGLDIDNPTFIPKVFKTSDYLSRFYFIFYFFSVCDIGILNSKEEFKHNQLLNDIHFINNSTGVHTSLSNIKVEKLKEDVYYGFTIDGNHRFLLGDFTITHNTLSMVSLVYNNKMPWNVEESHCETQTETYSSHKIKKISKYYYNRIDTTLVLASQSIVKQWVSEFQKTPLSVALVSTRKQVENINAENYDVIIITPTMFNSYIRKYKDMAWKRFIFDEAQSVKIPDMEKIVFGFMWFVTATPNDITYKHYKCKGFMASIVSNNFYLCNTLLKEITVKNDDAFVETSFAMPPTINNYYKCSNKIYNTIKGFVNDKILELISAGNIQGAIKSLGGTETSNIKELVKQRKIGEIQELEKQIEILTIQDRMNKIDGVVKEIQRIKGQIQELDERFNNICESDCNICLDKLTNPVMEPNCQNIFCSECLLTWLKNHSRCPLCRTETDFSKFIYIQPTRQKPSVQEETNNETLTQIDTVIKIINSNPSGRIILFSCWDETFIPIRSILTSNDITFGEVKGTVEARNNLIQKFKNGEVQVIFLNANFNGAGINLQETTDIIVFHEMHNSLLTQIIGRANRIGRTNSLTVHHLQLI
jgi:hypothetical protein